VARGRRDNVVYLADNLATVTCSPGLGCLMSLPDPGHCDIMGLKAPLVTESQKYKLDS